eukprot:7322-Pyramimonas_sp.AAC.1
MIILIPTITITTTTTTTSIISITTIFTINIAVILTSSSRTGGHAAVLSAVAERSPRVRGMIGQFHQSAIPTPLWNDACIGRTAAGHSTETRAP